MNKTVHAATVIILLLLTSPVCASSVIAKFKGPNGKTTRVFTVKPLWQIKYHTPEPAHFSIVVHDEFGKYIDLAVNDIGPAEGLYSQSRGGKYYLEVSSDGNWYIDIIQVNRKKQRQMEASRKQ